MNVLGWVVLAAGLLGCVFAGFAAVATIGQSNAGAQTIALAIAALGGVYGGLKLIELSRSNQRDSNDD